MIQIIGKGGFGREVSLYTTGGFEMFENDCEGIKQDIGTVIAIGDCEARKKIAEKFSRLNYTAVNAGAVHWSNKIGYGSIICPGTIITTNVTIGNHVIINLNCTVGHDCIIGDFTTISPGANISGSVTIGECCYIGSNAVVIQGISICSNVIIGAGAVVIKDILEPGTYVGNPCKKVK